VTFGPYLVTGFDAPGRTDRSIPSASGQSSGGGAHGNQWMCEIVAATHDVTTSAPDHPDPFLVAGPFWTVCALGCAASLLVSATLTP
jgi:hypothetical protein